MGKIDDSKLSKVNIITDFQGCNKDYVKTYFRSISGFKKKKIISSTGYLISPCWYVHYVRDRMAKNFIDFIII